MKKLFILLVISFICITTFSQPYYSKVTTPSQFLSSYALENLELNKDTIIFNTFPVEKVDGQLYANTYFTKYRNGGTLISATKLGVESKQSKILLDGDKILIVGTFKESTRDSLQILLVHGGNVSQKFELYNPYSYQGLGAHFQFLKFNDQFVILCSGSYFLKQLDFEHRPYIIWVNSDFTLDSVMRVDLPYGEFFDYGIDDNGHLNILAQYHSDRQIAGPNMTKNYQGYIKLDESKKIIHSYFEEQNDWRFPYTKRPQGVFYPDGTKIMTGPYGQELRIISMDKNDKIVWQDSIYRDQDLKYNEHCSFTKCQNGDVSILATNFHKRGLSDMKDQFETSFIQRYDQNGNEKFFRSYGYYNQSSDRSEGNWLYDIKEMNPNNIIAIGAVAYRDPHALYPGQLLNDSTWILSVDSMGCIDKDKCNDVIVWRAPNNLYQYDQINVRHKEWYISNSTDRYSQYFGQDTNMFDHQQYGWLRYRPIVYKNLDSGVETKDTVFATWTREGRMYISPSNFNPFASLPIYPLYDFTLKSEDTFMLPYSYGKAIVSQVDSISLIPGYLRKRIILKHQNSTNQSKYGDLVWIEGIGSPNGILYYKDWQQGTKTELTCYYDRGEKRYSSTDDPDCRKQVETSVMLPIINQNIIRYVVINSFTLPHNRMERWRFDLSSTIMDVGNTYFELLISNQEDGNGFVSSGRFFREEDNRFYQYISTTAGERLLYDMNLSLGDSITIAYKDGTRKMVVTEVDSVTLTDQKIRKRLTLQCVINGELESGESAIWIEGIGRLYESFVDFSHCSIWDVDRPEIVCMYDGVLKIYKSEKAPDDCWIKPLVIDTTDMDRSTVWYSSSLTGNILPDFDCELKIDVTKVMRDTLVGNRLCRIIGVTSGGKYFQDSEIIEYSKDGRMYFYEDGEWKLLYDFNAKVGDTVTFYISKKYHYYNTFTVPGVFDEDIINNNPYQLRIVKIDTIYSKDGKPLIRFNTQNVDLRNPIRMDYVYENIGSKGKLFGYNNNYLPPECFKNFPILRCYSDDDISIKFTEGECDKLTFVKDISTETVDIHPNPGQDRLFFTLSDNFNLPAIVQMTDISGKLLMNNTLQLTKFEISTSHFTSGLYIITIRDSQGKISSAKWMKE